MNGQDKIINDLHDDCFYTLIQGLYYYVCKRVHYKGTYVITKNGFEFKSTPVSTLILSDMESIAPLREWEKI